MKNMLFFFLFIHLITNSNLFSGGRSRLKINADGRFLESSEGKKVFLHGDPGAMDMVRLYDLFNTHLSVSWGKWIPDDNLILEEDRGQVEDICWRHLTSKARAVTV